MHNKTNKGFTLIEVIVIVAIIGLLASLAMPNVVGQITYGQRVSRRAEAVEFANLLNKYIAITGDAGDHTPEITLGKIKDDITQARTNGTKPTFGIILPVFSNDATFAIACKNVKWKEKVIGADDVEYNVNRFEPVMVLADLQLD